MNVQRIASVGSVAIVIVAVIGGLLLTGSPSEQRLLRFDERRAMGLQQLSRAAIFRWDRQQRLPDTAAQLVDGQLMSRIPVDPVSGQPYEYRVTAPQQFEVCATFDRPSRPSESDDFWFHDAGRRCFTFDVTQRPPGRMAW
jgi:hypothetical protein